MTRRLKEIALEKRKKRGRRGGNMIKIRKRAEIK